MSETVSGTDRRSFLKTGALVAAPIGAVAIPAAALADDGSRAKLARIEDERAIEKLHRTFVRRVNGGKADTCGELFCRGRGPELPDGLRSLREDPPAPDAEIAFADDCRSAQLRRACTVELQTEFEGDTTIEKMARWQGQGRHRHSERRALVAEYRKTGSDWAIERLTLA